ncbi:helix-turn-helix domain-containing protein [Inquilinus sp.]|jgi:transcriptional regulator with XRE-family HTH domain|uniref:helix-turn-helix domain-containing protein n=1 Tax=Inquilinus sp. TaxID=1932117 RepID=UPI003783E524
MNVNADDDDGFRDRMNVAIEMAGGITALARTSGLSDGVLQKYRKGGSDPSRSRLIAIAKASGLSLRWLATGEGLRTAAEVDRAEAATGAGTMRRDEPSSAADRGLYESREAAAPANLHEAPAAYGWDPQLMEGCILIVNDLAHELDRQLNAAAEAKLILELYRLELERKQQGERLRTGEVVRLFMQAG